MPERLKFLPKLISNPLVTGITVTATVIGGLILLDFPDVGIFITVARLLVILLVTAVLFAVTGLARVIQRRDND